jgi:uncharacterized protein (DUF58 family)
VSRRPTKRAVIIALVGALLFIAGATAQASWLFVMAAGVLGLLVASTFMRFDLGNVVVERDVPRRTRVGDEVRAGLVIRNQGTRALPLHRVEDHFEAFGPTSVLVEPLRPGQSAHAELVRDAHRRGVFTGADVVQTTGAPFGLLRSSRRVHVPSDLTVVPDWVDLRSFPILEPSSFPSDLLHERARTGAGEEFLGVRDYRPGDPPRAVHWRSTARAGHLIVREFEEQVASRVALVLAGEDAGTPPDSAFEMLVSALASVGMYALSTGHPLHVVRSTPTTTPEQLVEPDRFALLDWLAAAVPVDRSLEPLVQTTLERIGRRGTVILFAPTIGKAGGSLRATVRLVQAAGSRPIVVAARSSSWATNDLRDEISEMDLAGAGGRRAGFHMISAGDDLAGCLSAA